MKWKNPGHEFDAVYKEMCAKQEFYFFGAGDYGRQLRPIMQDEIQSVCEGILRTRLGCNQMRYRYILSVCGSCHAIPCQRRRTDALQAYCRCH